MIHSDGGTGLARIALAGSPSAGLAESGVTVKRVYCMIISICIQVNESRAVYWSNRKIESGGLTAVIHFQENTILD